jgi:hypothetical protein
MMAALAKTWPGMLRRRNRTARALQLADEAFCLECLPAVHVLSKRDIESRLIIVTVIFHIPHEARNTEVVIRGVRSLDFGDL